MTQQSCTLLIMYINKRILVVNVITCDTVTVTMAATEEWYKGLCSKSVSTGEIRLVSKEAFISV